MLRTAPFRPLDSLQQKIFDFFDPAAMDLKSRVRRCRHPPGGTGLKARFDGGKGSKPGREVSILQGVRSPPCTLCPGTAGAAHPLRLGR